MKKKRTKRKIFKYAIRNTRCLFSRKCINRKGIVRAGSGNNNGKGIVRAGSRNNKGKGVVRAGYGRLLSSASQKQLDF